MNGYNSTSSGTVPNSHAVGARDRKDTDAPESGDERPTERPREYGGRKKGLEPTRYGDWEKDGRCIDF